jgi:hypothetical protein
MCTPACRLLQSIFKGKGNGRDVAQTDIEIILFDIQILVVFVKSHQDGLK